MKVTVEYSDPFEAKVAIQAMAYVEFVEEFERFLINLTGVVTRAGILDKFSALRDLYKI